MADVDVERRRGKARLELKAEGLKGEEGSAVGIAGRGEGDGGDTMMSNQKMNRVIVSSSSDDCDASLKR